MSKTALTLFMLLHDPDLALDSINRHAFEHAKVFLAGKLIAGDY